MAGIQNLGLYQGDDASFTVFVTTDGTNPANITGYTAQAQMRADVADNCSSIALTIATSVSSPNVTLTIPRTQTSGLAGRYLWDLQLTAPSGTIQTILRGSVLVVQEVTRP